MTNEEANINNNIMKNKRKSFLITHKKDLINLCETIGGTKGKLFAYLINNMVFTDSTVKTTYKKISKKTGISYASVAKSMKEFENNGLIKRKNGYLMIVPTLLMRGDYQSENRLLKEFKEFNEDVDFKYTKKIKSYSIVDEYSEILIVNSDPTKGRSKENSNYYSKESDIFWELIFPILKIEDPLNYGDRISALNKQKIALWDVMYTVQIIDNHKIKKTREYNDFRSFFYAHKNIKVVICNGGEAYRLLIKYISNNNLNHIMILKLTTSSPSRGKYLKSYEEKLKEWEIINKYRTCNNETY